jgi:ABC-type uncharacterized transport system permease subunit
MARGPEAPSGRTCTCYNDAMPAVLERMTLVCFGASYALALGLEVARLLWPQRGLRLAAVGMGAAGLLAHTLYVLWHPLPLGTPRGSLVFLSWIIAIFYLYGTLHHPRVAWALFVLPVVLGLTVLAGLYETTPGGSQVLDLFTLSGERFWGVVHGVLLLLAAVGICVSFVASVMYLLQVRRLRAKAPPEQKIRLLSLERLERMTRRGILLAFPLLTASLLIGLALLFQQGPAPADWGEPKVLSAAALWLVFALAVYVRYRSPAPGRRVAALTILAFVLLLLSLAAPGHPFVSGGQP